MNILKIWRLKMQTVLITKEKEEVNLDKLIVQVLISARIIPTKNVVERLSNFLRYLKNGD